MVDKQFILSKKITHSMVLICWPLILLASLQITESFPQPRADLAVESRESRNTRELRPNKGNRFSFQPSSKIYPEGYSGNNDDGTSRIVDNYDNQYALGYNNQYETNNHETNIDRAIQEVFYPEHPTMTDISGNSGDISFPQYKLASPKQIELKKPKENPQIFQYDSSSTKDSILRGPNSYVNYRKSWQDEIKNKRDNNILKSILDLDNIDLNQISLKQAFLKRAETYNITETGDKDNNFLVEKKVNVSTNLKYLNSNNQLANFSDFHSSILQEILSNDHKQFSRGHQPATSKVPNYKTEENNKNYENDILKQSNDFVGGQFIGQELLGGQYPEIRTQIKTPYDLRNNPDTHDFVAGQYIEYNKPFITKQRTAENTDPYEIGIQPSEFVGGQFVGGSGILGEPNNAHGALRTLDMSSFTNDGTEPVNDQNTERYEDQIANELRSLSILGMKHDIDEVDESSTDLAKQGVSQLSRKQTKQQDNTPIIMGTIPKFNKGISQKMGIVGGIINEPGYNDQTTIDTVKTGNTEVDTPEDLQTYSYSTTNDNDLLTTNSLTNDKTTTISNTMNPESLAYEDYNVDDVVGSIIDYGNNEKEQFDAIQGQPSQINSNFMGTTVEGVDIVPLNGFSNDKDHYNTFQETSTQLVKDVYLYAGKDYQNNTQNNMPELNEITTFSNKVTSLTEERSKENYPTDICFRLNNKEDISLLEILSGNVYLEKNGKKIAFSLEKNPMKNCTSGSNTCTLYFDVKNVSHTLEFDNEEDNSIPRNKRQSKMHIPFLIGPRLKENNLERTQNKTDLQYKNDHFNSFPFNTSTSKSSQKNATEILFNYKKTKIEPHEEYSQPMPLTNQEVTTHKSRTKRSTADSDSCSCSNLFKSTQIPSYKHFIGKRLDILTNIVVAAQHFMNS